MSQSPSRRPLPAIIFLVGLTVLTAVVWWRVLNRTEDAGATKKTAVAHSTSSGKPSAGASCTNNPTTLPQPKTVSVSVFNGTGRDGVARSIQNELQRRGFVVSRIDTAPNVISQVAQIQYGPSGKTAAKLLSFYVNGAQLVASARADAQLDLVLGSAFRALATAKQVSTAVAAASRKC